jgi:hypothetical protein
VADNEHKTLVARPPWLLFAVPLVAACQVDATLQVAKTSDGRIEFRVSTPTPRDDLCINALSILNSSGPETESIWSISNENRSLCRDRISYGLLPPGYRADVSPHALVPNQVYRVVVYGNGFNAGGNLRLTDLGLKFTESQ